MTKQQKCSMVAAFLSVICATSLAHASLVTRNANGAGTRTRDSVIGYQFTVGGTAAQINALGVYDHNSDGLLDAHDVGIWDSSNVLLRSVSVPSGTSATLLDDFRYADVAPLTLSAGTTYVIGALFFNSEGGLEGSGNPAVDDPFIDGDPRPWDDVAGITTLQSRFNDSGTLVQPTVNGGNPIGRWAGANATFIAPPSAAPEPSTLVLAALGMLSVCATGRRRRTR